MYPILGLQFSGTGSNAYSRVDIGASLGYRWNDILENRLTYAHTFFTGGSADQASLEAIARFDLESLKPHVLAGIGLYRFGLKNGPSDTSGTGILGAGLSVYSIGAIRMDVGMKYFLVFDGPNFFQPYVTGGIAF